MRSVRPSGPSALASVQPSGPFALASVQPFAFSCGGRPCLPGPAPVRLPGSRPPRPVPSGPGPAPVPACTFRRDREAASALWSFSRVGTPCDAFFASFLFISFCSPYASLRRIPALPLAPACGPVKVAPLCGVGEKFFKKSRCFFGFLPLSAVRVMQETTGGQKTGSVRIRRLNAERRQPSVFRRKNALRRASSVRTERGAPIVSRPQAQKLRSARFAAILTLFLKNFFRLDRATCRCHARAGYTEKGSIREAEMHETGRAKKAPGTRPARTGIEKEKPRSN